MRSTPISRSQHATLSVGLYINCWHRCQSFPDTLDECVIYRIGEFDYSLHMICLKSTAKVETFWLMAQRYRAIEPNDVDFQWLKTETKIETEFVKYLAMLFHHWAFVRKSKVYRKIQPPLKWSAHVLQYLCCPDHTRGDSFLQML